MKIDIPNKIIYFRSSETSSWIKCMRQAALIPPKDLEDEEEESSGAAAGLGTKVHFVIQQILKGEPYMMDAEVSPIIGIPCKFEEYIPYKKIITIEPTFPEVCETEQEKIKWIKFHYDAMKVYQQNGEYKAIVNTEDYSDTGLLSISDIIHPKMFGKDPLVRIEHPLKWEFPIDDWKIVFTGKLDAATDDYSLIVDWKTSARTPTGEGHEFDFYKMQQCIYKLLANLSVGDEYREGIAILAFLVKTKTPKFVPKCFEIKKEHLKETKEFIFQCGRTLIDYINKGVLPPQSITGSGCDYCKAYDKCFTLNPRIPVETITCQRVINR